MSNLLSTKIIVVSILVPVYSHEHRVNHNLHIQYLHYLVHTIGYYKQNKPVTVG